MLSSCPPRREQKFPYRIGYPCGLENHIELGKRFSEACSSGDLKPSTRSRVQLARPQRAAAKKDRRQLK
jgi:hypothetical protein